MNLYEMTEEMKALEALLDEHAQNNDGDVTGVNDTLEEWASEIGIERKLENTARLIQNLGALAEAQKAESKRLADQARVSENKIARIKDWVIYCMNNLGRNEMICGHFTIQTRKHGVAPVVIDDESKLPNRFIVIKKEADKKAIGVALRLDAEELKGIAHFGDVKTILKIK